MRYHSPLITHILVSDYYRLISLFWYSFALLLWSVSTMPSWLAVAPLNLQGNNSHTGLIQIKIFFKIWLRKKQGYFVHLTGRPEVIRCRPLIKKVLWCPGYSPTIFFPLLCFLLYHSQRTAVLFDIISSFCVKYRDEWMTLLYFFLLRWIDFVTNFT